MPDIDRLSVYKDDLEVGTLTCDAQGRVRFTYDDAVIDMPTAAVSVRLPVRAAPYEDHDALPCFENLLPEGDIRRMMAIATQHAPQDVIGLLGVFGGECAGALSLWPEGTAPHRPPSYVSCTPDALTAAMGIATDVARMANTLRDARLSMSGAQDKLVLYRRPPTGMLADDPSTPEYRLPRAGAPSTVLVKRDRGQYPGLVQNEIAAMSLMAAAGVPTAPHTVNALVPDVYETARFDRRMDPAGQVTRLHAEDGCQLTGKVSRAKYAQTGGPTYSDLIAALTRVSAAPVLDAEVLFRWAVANLAIGNRDAHAKNVSILYQDAETIGIAPAYDVVCTTVYPIDAHLPLTFGGAKTMNALQPHCLKVAAREFRMTAPRAAQLTDAVTAAILAALDDVLHGTTEVAGHHPILDAMRDAVREETERTRARLLGT